MPLLNSNRQFENLFVVFAWIFVETWNKSLTGQIFYAWAVFR